MTPREAGIQAFYADESTTNTLQGLNAAFDAYEAADRRLDRMVDYSIDLQRIIEGLCGGGPIPEPKTTARWHYDMAVAALSKAKKA